MPAVAIIALLARGVWAVRYSKEHPQTLFAWLSQQLIVLLYVAINASDMVGRWIVPSAVEEAQIALIRLYQRYTFRIPLGAPDPPPLRIGITCAFRDGLPVHVIPRH
jgi:hypothetical protein